MLWVNANRKHHATLRERTGWQIDQRFQLLRVESIIFARRKSQDAHDIAVVLSPLVCQVDYRKARTFVQLGKRGP